MSDDLKNAYKGAGALDSYFDGKTPVDLFRWKKIGAKGDFMQPFRIRFTTRWRRRTVINRCRLLDRIKRVSPEVENDEHLSETVLDIDQALGELAHLYDVACSFDGGGYGYDRIVANAEEDYKQDCDERENR